MRGGGCWKKASSRVVGSQICVSTSPLLTEMRDMLRKLRPRGQLPTPALSLLLPLPLPLPLPPLLLLLLLAFAVGIESAAAASACACAACLLFSPSASSSPLHTSLMSA